MEGLETKFEFSSLTDSFIHHLDKCSARRIDPLTIKKRILRRGYGRAGGQGWERSNISSSLILPTEIWIDIYTLLYIG